MTVPHTFLLSNDLETFEVLLCNALIWVSHVFSSHDAVRLCIFVMCIREMVLSILAMGLGVYISYD